MDFPSLQTIRPTSDELSGINEQWEGAPRGAAPALPGWIYPEFQAGIPAWPQGGTGGAHKAQGGARSISSPGAPVWIWDHPVWEQAGRARHPPEGRFSLNIYPSPTL